MALPAVPTVPDYDLLRRIGGGAYGEVWLARNKATGMLRAAKIVWRHKFEDERPFQREFEGIQKFERITREHPRQLALFHIGRNEAEGNFYYVMELADDLGEQGKGLKSWSNAGGQEVQDRSTPTLQNPDGYVPRTLRADLSHGRLPADRVLEIALALVEALGHLHRNGLIHRDVKPSNVIFVNGRPKLADIGLVTDASDQCSIVGTEGYLPLEGPGTPQADIFALGKVLYEAVTGLDRRRFPDLPQDLREWEDAAAIRELNQVVLRACAADVQQRYKTADEMQIELAGLAKGRSVLRDRRLTRRWRLARRGGVWLAAVAAAVSFLALLDHMVRRRGGSQPTVQGSAHPSYTRGRTHLDEFLTGQDLQRAADAFKRSIQAEPGFAPAYGCLAYTYTISSYDGWNPLWTNLPKAQEYALEGLKRGDEAEAHLALAWYEAVGGWRWQEAQREYGKALALQPSSALGRLSHAEFLRMIGHAEEGLKELKVAMSIEPHPKVLDARLPAFEVDAKHYNEALAAIEKARDSIPRDWLLNTERSALCALGRFADAIERERKFRLSTGELDQVNQRFSPWKQAFDSGGTNGYWRAGIKMTQGFEQTCFYAQAGEKDKALTQLESDVKRKDRSLLFHVMTDWRLDDLRSEPRFQNLLKEMNLLRPMSEGGLPSPPPLK
jgi:serine/threonine protein kinase